MESEKRRRDRLQREKIARAKVRVANGRTRLRKLLRDGKFPDIREYVAILRRVKRGRMTEAYMKQMEDAQ